MDVLYLALEDTPWLMKERLNKVLQGAPAPGRLHINFQAFPGAAGVQELQNWLGVYRDTRLIIVDVLGKICDLKPGNYHADYEVISQFKGIADRYKIAIVLVHHLRKTGARDELDLVSGSTGLTGAVDTVVLLTRKRLKREATLLISRRHQKETELALQFDEATGIWEPREQTEGQPLTPERQEIVELLHEASGPLRLQEIAQALGKKRANVANLMNNLVKQELAERVRYGYYRLKS